MPLAPALTHLLSVRMDVVRGVRVWVHCAVPNVSVPYLLLFRTLCVINLLYIFTAVIILQIRYIFHIIDYVICQN